MLHVKHRALTMNEQRESAFAHYYGMHLYVGVTNDRFVSIKLCSLPR